MINEKHNALCLVAIDKKYQSLKNSHKN